jgi:hypothetical protein
MTGKDQRLVMLENSLRRGQKHGTRLSYRIKRRGVPFSAVIFFGDAGIQPNSLL